MLNNEYNKYSATITINASIATKISQQYYDLKFIISEKDDEVQLSHSLIC